MRCLPQFLTIPIFAVVLAAPPTSQRSSPSTFREEADGLSVYVDGYPGFLGAKDAYVAVPVAMTLLRKGPSVAFTPESFMLVDAKGNRVPAATFDEVKNGFPKLGYERNVVRMLPIVVGLTLEDRPRIAANFYPATGAEMRIPRVELAPYTWFTDVIYFPRPPAGLGGVMTLSVAVPGGVPIDVRFLMSPNEPAKR